MRFVTTNQFKRAATCAALFVLVLSVAMPAFFIPVFVTLAHPAQARMRLDRLTIEPAGGGAPHAFDIELATTEQEKALGLMFRTSLADTEGMLFPYANAQIMAMWMHNTYISLDMVFIRGDGVIQRIEAQAEPLSDRVISSEAPVTAVLELAGGAAGRLGIKPGDLVRHAAFDAAKKP
jgi:uncharacterized protein